MAKKRGKQAMSDVLAVEVVDPPLLEFVCHVRQYDPNMDGYHYVVEPLFDYDGEDLGNTDIVINGVIRRCESSTVDDAGTLVAFVPCTPGD